jgi:predicted transcriptional regulator of viral defense system
MILFLKERLDMKPVKTLGPRGAALVAALGAENRSIFQVEDAQRVTGLLYSAAVVLLNKLVARDVLARLRPGKYLILPSYATEPTENWYVVGRELIAPKPYYISHYSAMAIHEMVTQPVLVVYISTPVRRRDRRVGGADFRFIFARTDTFWGLEKKWITQQEQVQVSDLERTILDCLTRPELCGGITEVAKGIWRRGNDIDYARLVEYTGRAGVKAVTKRLGFLLETLELGGAQVREDLQVEIEGSHSYALLDPSLPKKGRYLAKWRLRLNVSVEQIRESIWA